ncbi:MAG: tRNA lysidine(34) synthetase TilS, partial [Sphingorhabdus sp.]
GGSIQASARTARYALLEQAADAERCDVIVTAHHGDDQLETVLMRLARGSGISGLSAIRPRNGRVIRPLLEFSKSELEEICKQAGIKPVRDPSNEDAEYDRVAMRQWLARAQHPFQIDRVNRSVNSLYESGLALEWMAQQLAIERISKKSHEIQCDAEGLPHELKRRLLLLALAQISPDLEPRGEAVQRLLGDLDAGRTRTIGDILCKGGSPWRFAPAPARRIDA